MIAQTVDGLAPKTRRAVGSGWHCSLRDHEPVVTTRVAATETGAGGYAGSASAGSVQGRRS